MRSVSTNSATKWLGPQLRERLKSRLVRRRAFSVRAQDRRTIRNIRAALELHFPGVLEDLRILPISTAEWTSELRTFDGISAIIFDVEQVNALDFLCARQMAAEHPILHFNEHLIRAAEL